MGVVDGLDKGTAFVMMVVAAIALGTWLNVSYQQRSPSNASAMPPSHRTA